MALRIDTKTYRLAEDQYVRQRTIKDLIVLHFTAGQTCASAFHTWAATADRVATAYGVDPGGTIYEFFPAEYYAYHLGIQGTQRHDKRSIGIEIANVGPLKLSRTGEWLHYWPKHFETRFCQIAETHRYVEKSYRGFDYYAAMPAAQQAAVGELVRHLAARFHVPVEWDSAAEAGEYAPAHFETYKGIASHANFRADKFDVGPAFDWRYLRDTPLAA